jgi:hypothetical protein
MDELSEILRAATAAIEMTYFRLNIDGGDPVFRERVYCYELYHQMRMHWTDRCPFVLNGEVDKSGHQILKSWGADQAKPDLLVHTPGAMKGNYAIIEVKHRLNPAGIRKDLNTLDLFVRKVGYQRAIYLIYGSEADKYGLRRIQETSRRFAELEPIEVWLHHDAGQSAIYAATLQQSRTDMTQNGTSK